MTRSLPSGPPGPALRLKPGSSETGAPPIRTPSSRLSGCWGRPNRLLPRTERLADMLLGVLQEFFSATQGVPASVQNLSGLLVCRPQAVRCPDAHAARLFPQIVRDPSSPEPCDGGA